MKNHILIISTLVTLLLSCSASLIAQQQDLIINDIGGLFSENRIFFDGGLGHLKLNINKKNVDLNDQNIKLECQLKDESDEPVPFFEIYLGKIEDKNKLIVEDTLYVLSSNKIAETDYSKKEIRDTLNGIFILKTKIKEGQAIYINSLGYSMLEIRLKRK